jgi:hypothetical protein
MMSALGSRLLAALALLLPLASAVLAAPVHTSYLWHMHQPIYWPDRSTWYGVGYDGQPDDGARAQPERPVRIFNKDDRIHDYQDYPRSAVQSVLGLPDAGAQVSFAGSLIQNLNSLGNAGWNGGRYASNWWQSYRDAMNWSTSGGRRRLDPVIGVHASPDQPAVRRGRVPSHAAGAEGRHGRRMGSSTLSKGFFPAEMCFSERLIPVLRSEGIEWSIVPDLHLARACANYPAAARTSTTAIRRIAPTSRIRRRPTTTRSPSRAASRRASQCPSRSRSIPHSGSIPPPVRRAS